MRKPRFSLISIFTIVSVVAGLLALQAYLHGGQLKWRHLAPLALAFVALGIAKWLAWAAPWSARMFAIGFVLGAMFDLAALSYWLEHDLVRFTAGGLPPDGYYPLSLPVARAIISSGWGSWKTTQLPAVFIGMSVSGTFLGSIFMAAWHMLARRRIREATFKHGC